ncbi:helix-turn-helix domain-containing protein [Sporolactobacillus terrae]|uniref:helix-turn-helix domain-containing protein n=1 Tax=Sporolactobacillus terrae TaxID=269673 RepID=UPI00056BC7EB|nr:helix-turn-helix transcriptional regulator [Sporolactobacillus terrae]UAK17597.1 helix-turn-helix domain-containing protein [Sporolactobacillus terrae]
MGVILLKKALGDRLKELRESKRLSQKEAASRFGITNFQLSRYETGKANPDPDLIAKFAEYYEVTSDYLLGLSDIKNPEKRSESRFFFDLDDATEEDLEDLEQVYKMLQRRKQKRQNKDSD